jgi:DNA-binding NarL/FixJ family response regulator
MRILLADDNVGIRAALRLLLEEFGKHDIIEAADEQELLCAAERTQPDVIILDWELPEGSSQSRDGLPQQARSVALVKELRRRCRASQIIATSTGPEAEESSQVAGCDGFVSRNEPPDRLLTLLRIEH